MNPFSCILTPQSVSFTTPDGKVHNITSSHENWDEIITTIKDIQAAAKMIRDGQTDESFEIGSHAEVAAHRKLAELVNVAKKINDAGEGRVVVRSGVVYYEDEPVNNAITRRILWGLSEGYDMSSYMRFLDNSMENPSAQSVEEMYGFLEANNMGITEDGYILGYKRVRDDFKDIRTGKFDNSPGQILEMRRNKVDDNRHRTCSYGFHFCAMSYLPHYGAGPGNKVVIVKVHPRDVVSVPTDYRNAKVRCCRYEVLSEYTGSDLEDLLATKPVWSDSDFTDDGDWDEREFDDEEYDTDIDDFENYDPNFEHYEADDESEGETCSDESVSEVEEVLEADRARIREEEERQQKIAMLREQEERSRREMQGDDRYPFGGVVEQKDTEQQAYDTPSLGPVNFVEAVKQYEADKAVETAFPSDLLGDPERLSELAGIVDDHAPEPEPVLDDNGPNLDDRAGQLFEEAMQAMRRKLQEEQQKIEDGLREAAREQAIQEFNAQLFQGAKEAFAVWIEDCKKAPNLPTHDEIQKLLGELAAELRAAEIKAGDPQHKSGPLYGHSAFDWETWLKERTNKE